MKVKKAGTILINLPRKEIGIVYREKRDDYTFPKGHLEDGESLKECAVRETEEETGRKNHIIYEEKMHIENYITPLGEDVECYYYLAIDDGKTDKDIEDNLKEKLVWIDYKALDKKISYESLKKVWENMYPYVDEILNNIIPANLTDMGVCPTCYNKENGNILYGENETKMLYEDEDIECFLVGNPRAEGHTAISSKKHYKDMMEIPDDLCDKVFKFAKKTMNVIKEVYGSESVYLCTMCDGPMNHFHIQLIPRYSFEKRGSKNFIKERKEYIEDKEKIDALRKKLS